jgi:hypothetical protein
LVRSLPLLADRLEAIAASTSELREFRAGIDAVGEDTEVLATLDRRMAHVEASMPGLVAVQQHPSTLQEAMEALGAGLDRLATLMDRLLASIHTLDGNVEALRGSLEPIGRVADRLPGNRKSAD